MGSPTILLLEDDFITVALITAIISDAGYAFEHADNTDSAMLAIERNTPDILLSDWSIDGSVGAGEVAKLLRRKKPEAQIIFITGHSQAELESQLLGLEPYLLYQKPVDYDFIIQQLSNPLAF